MNRFTLPTPDDESEAKVVSDVRQYGWHVLGVREDDEGPGFAFTIGLYYSFRHPEVLIMGLEQATAHSVLNSLGDKVRAGVRYEPKREYGGVVEQMPVSFVQIADENYREYLGYAMWF